MPKIVYNTCHGGFDLSPAGIRHYAALVGLNLIEHPNEVGDTYFTLNGEYFGADDIERTDPHLIQTIEELGAEANGSGANLQLTTLPAGTRYLIQDYDGKESIVTDDMLDWRVA